ncbi:MAG: hypothetical protein BroJett030_20650 [Alphaproteobacteria bacterium]|nr:MAG: hypothetical protein BroJett030_20650 [Alphaproteobacteria bacterium]
MRAFYGVMHPLRRYRQSLLFLVLALAGAPIALWLYDWIDAYRTPEQVKVVRQFLEALRTDDCARGLTHLDAESRLALAAETPGPASRYAYCWPRTRDQFVSLRSSSARLASHTAGRATVSIERHVSDPDSFLVPGFWATRSIATTVTIELVEEAGAWKVMPR